MQTLNLDLSILREYLPFIIPLAAAQLGLALFAFIHVIRHPNYRFGNMLIWALVVLLVSWIGPVVYFAFGRGDR